MKPFYASLLTIHKKAPVRRGFFYDIPDFLLSSDIMDFARSA